MLVAALFQEFNETLPDNVAHGKQAISLIYRIPAGASSVLNGYIKQNLKFFVAKVNVKEQAKLGTGKTRLLHSPATWTFRFT